MKIGPAISAFSPAMQMAGEWPIYWMPLPDPPTREP
jgi:hypothetical protein